VVNKIEPKSLRAEDYKPTGITEAALGGQTKTVAAAASRPADAVPAAPPEHAKPSSAGAVAVAPPPAPVVGPATTPSQRDRIQVMSYNDFAVANEAILELYSEISSLEDTKEYLFKNCDILLHEHSQNYLLLSCLEDEMNRKHKRMKLVCRQSQIISHIIELAQSMKRDPREVVIPFFRRLEEKTHLDGFTGAVNDFIEKIKKRAVEKRREMDEEAAAERRASSANGLDPYEVLQSLPAPLKAAFEAQVRRS
jgi:cell division cycle protein 37